MKEYKNYLEHEENARAIDGCLSQSQEWDWFIKIVENSFDLEDVKNWQAFLEKLGNLASIYRLLIHIRRVSKCDLNPASAVLTDLIMISDYYNGNIRCQNCKPSTVFGMYLFLTVWIAKLLNTDNNTDNIYNAEIFRVKNYWGLVCIDSLLEEKDELLEYAENIPLSDWQPPLMCLRDNLNQIEYSYDKEFFSRYGEKLLQANTFSWQHLPMGEGLTWEERFLLEMSQTSIESSRLQPIMKSSAGDYPDISTWTEERIIHMTDFFRHPTATFVLESVRYLIYGKTPSDETIKKHAELWTEYSQCHESYQAFNCSSFKILECLLKEKKGNIARYCTLRERVQSFESPEDLIKLEAFPLSREQLRRIREYTIGQYREVPNAEGVSDFLDILRKKEVQKYIDNEYLALTAEKFRELAAQENRALAHLFYGYMCFLFKTKEQNADINKQWLEQEMIDTQLLWQEEYYKIQMDSMQIYESSVRMGNEEIEAFRKTALNSPISIAKSVMTVTNNGELCEAMASISEHPFSIVVSKITINEVFPIPDKFTFERHDVDQALLKHIQTNLKQFGYRYLNQLDPEHYVHELVARMNQQIQLFASFLNTSELYEAVRRCCESANYELIEYQNPVMPGHLMQLFPYLEKRIRELAKLSMVFPFKENLNEFMEYKDPSSILREIIEMIYKETESFELIPDILFVYYSMYNTHGLNIRNESVHGRANIKAPEQALRITCLAILMIEQRIKMMESNRI